MMFPRWFEFVMIALSGLLACVCLLPSADAHPLDLNECQGFARDALRIAEARDGGMQWEQAERELLGGIAIATTKPGTYLRDGEDTARLQGAAKQIFEVKQSPGEIYDLTLRMCQRAYTQAGGT